jgi:phage gp29-like protein
LIYPIAVLNGLATTIRRAPRMMFPTEDVEDIGTYSSALPTLVGIGMRIPRKWAQERLGIPEPEADDDDLLMPPSTPAPAESTGEPAIASATAQPQKTPQDPPVRMVGQLDQAVSPKIAQWVGQIRDMASQADSLEALRDGLMTLLPDLDLDGYAEAMRVGLAAAALAGRYEVLREAGGA